VVLRRNYNCLFTIILSTKDKNRHNCMNKNSNSINLIHARNSISSLCTQKHVLRSLFRVNKIIKVTIYNFISTKCTHCGRYTKRIMRIFVVPDTDMLWDVVTQRTSYIIYLYILHIKLSSNLYIVYLRTR